MTTLQFVVDIKNVLTPNGAFPCYGCSQLLDPDDESCEYYEVVEIEENGKSLVLECKVCGARTQLLLEV